MVTESEALTVPYSRDTFHNAFHISTAGDEFQERNGQKFISNILAPIFKKHRVEEVFGIGLVHRHFDIEEDEKLVEFNNISTPWAVDVGLHELVGKKTDSLIYETSWMLDTDNKWMAYEFSFSTVGGQDSYIVNIGDPKHYDFLVEHTQALKAAGWGDLLGLRAWPGPGFSGVFEFTQGKANINLIPEQASMEEGYRYQETQWFWANESFTPKWVQTYLMYLTTRQNEVDAACRGLVSTFTRHSRVEGVEELSKWCELAAEQEWELHALSQAKQTIDTSKSRKNSAKL